MLQGESDQADDSTAASNPVEAAAASATDQIDVDAPAAPELDGAVAGSNGNDEQSMRNEQVSQSDALSTDGGNETLKDLLSEFETADPILAAQAGFDLSKLKNVAEKGSIEPSALKAYIDLAKPADADDESNIALTDLDLQVEGAIRDQYAQFGITADDLRQYLEVSLDIEDAISAGRKPAIDPERYSTYQRVDELVKYGPKKSAQETARLDQMAEEEMLKMPWPTPMIREYMKKKKGAKLRRMNKHDMTSYDKVN